MKTTFNISNPKDQCLRFVLNDQKDFAFSAKDQNGDLVDVSGYEVLMQAKDCNGNIVYEWSTTGGTVSINTSTITFSRSVTIDTEGEFDYDIQIDNGTNKETVSSGKMYVDQDISE